MVSLLRSLRPSFDLKPESMDQRLRTRLTRGEFTGFALGMAMSLVFIYRGSAGDDFRTHIAAFHGDFSNYFYPYYFLPMYGAFGLLPLNVGYCIMNFINLVGIWLGGRIFNGKTAIALLSYQTLFMVFYGQTVGILIGGLAIMAWAMHHKRYWLAGLGLFLASIKYQLAIPFALVLWLSDDGSVKEKLRILAIPALVFAISLIVYPLWPLDLIHRTTTTPLTYARASIVLWRWIGPIALVLWLPVIFVPLDTGHRLVAVTSAAALALPYMQQHDLILLYCLPVGGIGLLGNFGYLFGIFQYQALQALIIIPILVYIWVFFDHFRSRANLGIAPVSAQESDNPV